MNGDLQREVAHEQALRALDPQLEKLVRRSPLITEESWQTATLRWLRGQSAEDRRVFALMLDGAERRADYEAQDDALVDRELAHPKRRR